MDDTIPMASMRDVLASVPTSDSLCIAETRQTIRGGYNHSSGAADQLVYLITVVLVQTIVLKFLLSRHG